MHEVLQGTSTGIHQSVNSSTSSAHSTHIKSLTTTTHSSPHLCTYLQVRFPPLYAQVDALLGCWSMVAVCQERPWTPAVHRDRNVKRGARARNERGMTITKHLQHPTCMTRDKLTHTHKNMLISPIPQSRPTPYHPTTTPGAHTRTTAGRGLPHAHPTPQPDPPWPCDEPRPTGAPPARTFRSPCIATPGRVQEAGLVGGNARSGGHQAVGRSLCPL